MGAIKNVLIGILALSAVVFCALFGGLPRLRFASFLVRISSQLKHFRKTPVGYVNRFIWITVPGLLLGMDRLLTGGQMTVKLKRAGRYLMWENHPFVLVCLL